jgi:spectinomycin phosphotransferase
MLEKPDLSNEKIVACLHDTYGLTVTSIEFLPLGYDFYAAVYRVTASNGQTYFLKAKRGSVNELSVHIPQFLKEQGIEQVVAPLPTTTHELWGTVDEYTLLLYPFIEGELGMEVGLSDDQWTEFGVFLKRLHATRLPAEIQVQKENFVPQWSRVVRQLQEDVQGHDHTNPFERQLAAFWRSKRDEIGRIVARTEQLGRLLQARSPDFVLCHADIHTANVLLTPDGRLHVVDWDQPILAPKERDLMFVIHAREGSLAAGDREETLFFQGYGEVKVDALALAYYRYEWVVQEIGDFGERVFLTPDVGDETKEDSVHGFMALFEPGDVVETAYQSE